MKQQPGNVAHAGTLSSLITILLNIGALKTVNSLLHML